MKEISLHLLDIAENSIAAQADRIRISVCEDFCQNRLRASVQDNGKGMDAETARRIIDPFYTTRTTRKVGLGIPLLKAAAESCNGTLSITSTPGKGTHLEVEFQQDHIDRMPLGDLPGTLLALVVSYPQVHWVFEYRVDHPARPSGPAVFRFDDRPVKEMLEGVPLSEPGVLAFLREHLNQGIETVKDGLNGTNLTASARTDAG